MKRVIAIRKIICNDFHLIIQIIFFNYIFWHAMDKHDICIYKKGAKNIIWPFLWLKEFFEVVFNGTTKGYFCLKK